MRTLLVTALLVAASTNVSAGTVYYVDIVNHRPSAIVAFDAAPAGSSRFHSALRGTPLAAGKAGTVAIRGEDGCLRDLRIGFADGHVETHRGFDLCAQERHAGRDDSEGVMIRSYRNP